MGIEKNSREKVRQDAAIAALPKCIETVEKVLLMGGKIGNSNMATQVAELACRYADALVNELFKEERNKEKNYKAGDYLYKLSHPKDDNLPEGGKRVFIYSGKITADGYCVLFGFTSDSELCSSSGYGNYCYGGNVRYASEEEIQLFVKEVHLYDKPIKKY